MPVVQINELNGPHDDPSRSLLLRSVADHYATEAIELGPGTSQSLRPVGIGEDAWMDYLSRLRGELRRLCPRVVIVRGARCLPALIGLKHPPAVTIYHAVDDSPFHSRSVAKTARGDVVRVDVALYPEELSAAVEMNACRRTGAASRIVYPCGTPSSDDKSAAAIRKPVIWLDDVQAFERFGLPISRCKDLSIQCGHMPKGEWRQAAFRFVGREPCCTYGCHVAPPSFFRAMAAGVPVVAAPHRQLQEFVGRYGCGIVMEAWTAEAFRKALETALALCHSETYDLLAANCRTACQRELNWATQFAKLVAVLPEIGGHPGCGKRPAANQALVM